MGMNNEKLVDIVIPIHYLPKSNFLSLIECLGSQTLIDKSIVTFIDDVSPNLEYLISSAQIGFDYRVIKNPELCGPGTSRQKAISSSSAKYITFLDADDLFYSTTSLEELYNGVLGYDAAYGGTRKADFNTKQVIRDDFANSINSLLHSSIYRREFLIDNNIGFTDHIIHEDFIFYFKIIFCEEIKTNLVDGLQYIYYIGNPQSLTSTPIQEEVRVLALYLAIFEIFKVFKSHNKKLEDIYIKGSQAYWLINRFIELDYFEDQSKSNTLVLYHKTVLFLFFAKLITLKIYPDFPEFLANNTLITNKDILRFMSPSSKYINYGSTMIELSSMEKYIYSLTSSSPLLKEKLLDDIIRR